MLKEYVATPRVNSHPVIVGPYELLEELGDGTSATVYRARDRYLDAYSAVKVLKKHQSSEMRAIFLNEAQMLARLKHPHIVHIINYGFQGDRPYFSMTLAEKGSLVKQHPLGQKLQMAQVLRYLRQLASAVDYLHAKGILHHDIKPANILQRQDNRLLLCDLHIATPFPYKQSSSVFLGTIPYTAPERFARPGLVSSASDLYSIGVIVYQWLTGSLPFHGTHQQIIHQHLHAEVPSLRKVRPTIPIEVERVVLKALAKNPWNRYASVHEFELALTLAWERYKQPQKNQSPYPIRTLIDS